MKLSTQFTCKEIAPSEQVAEEEEVDQGGTITQWQHLRWQL